VNSSLSPTGVINWKILGRPRHSRSFRIAGSCRAVVLESQGDLPVDGILALGDRPAVAASYVARGLGIHYNHPAAVEACRSKLRMREIFRDVSLPTPWFRSVPIHPPPEPALLGVSYPCVLKPLFAFGPARV